MPNTLDTNEGPEVARAASTWGTWLLWGWIVLLVLAAVSALFGLDDLRLALDFQRHLR